MGLPEGHITLVDLHRLLTELAEGYDERAQTGSNLTGNLLNTHSAKTIRHLRAQLMTGKHNSEDN